MALSSFDITIAKAQTAAITAVMCSAPTYTVSTVQFVAQPQFKDGAIVNGKTYVTGDSLISLVSTVGATVNSTAPLVVSGATTAAAAVTTITGTYYSSSSSAVFVLPFGTAFNSATTEYEAGGSPRQYAYTASFVAVSGGVTAVADPIIGGNVYMQIESAPRVPVGGASSSFKACNVTQS